MDKSVKTINNKTGLLFGSFNPIHTGHLIIANYFAQYSDINEVCFVVSPQNPFKTKTVMLDETIRYEMVCMAIDGNDKLKASDIELKMGVPSFTINTLTKLMEAEPGRDFVLLIGADNLDDFDKWKDYKKIFEIAEVYVYPRPGFKPAKFTDHPKVKLVSAPQIEISSSFIRKTIENNKDPRYLLPHNVYKFIADNNYYQKKTGK